MNDPHREPLRYLTVRQYAELKGISEKTVYREIRAGRLPAERVTARLYRIRMRLMRRLSGTSQVEQ